MAEVEIHISSGIVSGRFANEETFRLWSVKTKALFEDIREKLSSTVGSPAVTEVPAAEGKAVEPLE